MSSNSDTIAGLSSLTKVQVETLKIQLSVMKGEINIPNALKARKVSGISRGSYYRILAQAKHNIKKSLFTVAIAGQLGLVKAEDVQKLISSVCMIPNDVAPEKLPEVIALLEVVAERIVML